jgi:hypothetical protein
MVPDPDPEIVAETPPNIEQLLPVVILHVCPPTIVFREVAVLIV